ncbi:MAG: hypothetical protein LPH21_00585, partial [Shewanella sp.]|nr:hypothetical protein [Shewanella sp.]
MQNNIIRHLIASISGCPLDDVARVLQAARFISTRQAGTGTLDLVEGYCSSLPPTKEELKAVDLEIHSIVNSLERSLGDKETAINYLQALSNPASFVYSADDEEAALAADTGVA